MGTKPWADVAADPSFQALPPDKKEQIRSSYFDQVVAPHIKPDQLKGVRAKFDAQTLPKGTESVGPVLDRVLAAVPEPVLVAAHVPQMETGLHVASQIASLPFQAAGSITGLVTAPWGKKAQQASHNAAAIGEAMTYQPHTVPGKKMTEAVDFVGGLIPKGANWATEDIGEDPTVKKIFGNTGAEVVQGLANTAWQSLPMLLGLRGGRAGVIRAAEVAETTAGRAAAAEAAVTKAREFVEQKAGMKWDELAPDLKDKLVLVAKHAPEQLDQIKPEAVARESRLQKQGMPASRGNIERDTAQITHEETLSKGPAGKPLRDIQSGQDTRLGELVDEARGSTGAKAATRQGVGESVERALRGAKEENPDRWGRAQIETGLKSSAKAVWSKANYNRLFEIARKTEPDAAVSAEPIVKLLEKNPDVQELGWLQSWLKKGKVFVESEGEEAPKILDSSGKPMREAPEGPELRSVKLDELAHLREIASHVARTGQGSESFFAGKVVGAIDEAMEGVPQAAKAWRAAFDAFKKHKIEFEDQSLVNKLTEMKSRTDPKTALEDTADTVRTASAADIRNLKKTLTEGGTEKTRDAGTQAWKDIQGAMLDYLRRASNKSELRGADNQLEFNKGFHDAFNELDKDGKIEAVFDPKQVKALRELDESVQDVRTKPSKRVSGSDTAANLEAERQQAQVAALNRIEKAAKYGGRIGRAAAGVAQVVKGIKEKGQAVRDVATAKRSRLSEAAEDAATKARKQRVKVRRRNTLRSISKPTSVYGATTLNSEEKRRKQSGD